MNIPDVVAAIVALSGLSGGAWGAYAHLAAKIEATKAEAAAKIELSKAGLVEEQALFIKTTLEREERCREENHELRNDLMVQNARLLVVERSAMLAEVHLEVRGKLDSILEHFQISSVETAPVLSVEAIAHG